MDYFPTIGYYPNLQICDSESEDMEAETDKDDLFEIITGRFASQESAR